MKIKAILILSLVSLFILGSCNMQVSDENQNSDINSSSVSSRVLTGTLPVTSRSKCYNNSCYRYNTELTGLVRVLSSNVRTMKITNGADCPKCTFHQDHEVTYKHDQLLMKCVSCGYHSGSNQNITVLSCELQAPPVTSITGFRVEPHPHPSAPVEYAVWNAVPNAVKYVVVTQYQRPGYPVTTSTGNYTIPKVGLYKPYNYRVVSIRAYNSRNQLLAKYR